jgi:hypothetical protein
MKPTAYLHNEPAPPAIVVRLIVDLIAFKCLHCPGEAPSHQDHVICLNELRLQCERLLDEEEEDDGAFVIGLIMLMVRMARKRRRRQRRRRVLLGKFVIQDTPLVMQPTVMAPVTFKRKNHTPSLAAVNIA